MNHAMAKTTRRDLYQWWRSQHSFVYLWLNPFKSKKFNEFDRNFQKTQSLSHNNVRLSDFFSIQYSNMKSEKELNDFLSKLTEVAKSFLDAQLKETRRVMFSIDEDQATLKKYKAIQHSLNSLVENGYALDKVFHLYCLLDKLISQEESNCEKMITAMSMQKGALHQDITNNYQGRLLLDSKLARLPGINKCITEYFTCNGTLSIALDEVVHHYHQKIDDLIQQRQRLRAKFSKDNITLVEKLSAIRKDWRHQSYRTFFKRTSLTRKLDAALDDLIQSLTESTINRTQFKLSDNLSNHLQGVLTEIKAGWKIKRKEKTGFFDINFFSCFSSQSEKKSCRYKNVLTLEEALTDLENNYR
jgi:hypothetical protein